MKQGRMLGHLWAPLALQVLLLAGRKCHAIYSPSSLQTGPDLSGSTFPGSVQYDPIRHTIAIVGSTFGRVFEGGSDVDLPRQDTNCFLTTVQLPTERERMMQFDLKKSLGMEGVPEACLSALYHERNDKLIVAGHSERNGFMEDLYDASQLQTVTQYGMLLDIDVSSSTQQPYHLVGGRVLQEARVTYPMAIATTPADEWIYLATQYTDNVHHNTDPDDETPESPTVFDISAEVDPARWFEYGSTFRMRVNRFRRVNLMENNGLQQTFAQGWEHAFATTDNESIHVSGIVEIGDVVVLVGSTAGYGPEFGGEETVIGAGGDLDGYITKLDKETGRTVVLAGTGQRSSHRIQSLDGADDWIAGLCHDPTHDPEHLYIVGATGGNLNKVSSSTQNSVDAYLMKIQVSTLETVWTFQVGAQASSTSTADLVETRGISCAISPDGTSVWMGGVVQDDAVLPNSGTSESFGGDDVFVAKLQTEDGVLLFLRQFGSEEDDSLAMRGGLVIDKDMDCVVVGSTYGSLYRRRSNDEVEDEPWISDMFVTLVKGDNGEIAPPVDHPGFFKDNNSNNNNNPATVPSPQAAPKPNPESASEPEWSVDESNEKARSGLRIMIFVLVGSLTAALLFARNSRSSIINGDVTTDRSEVIHYLNAFEVDDIDLKHSATGGWHCSYSNDLSNGINRRSSRSYENPAKLRSVTGDDPLLTEPLTQSQIVRDSLFMDDADGGELGSSRLRGFGESRSRQRDGYDGLIDAYNADFNERRSSNRSSGEWGKEIL